MSSWKKFKLSELGEFRNGANYPKGSYGKGDKIVNVKDLFKGRFVNYNWLDELKKNALKNKTLYLTQHGDLLFTRSSLVKSGAGMVAMINSPKEDVLFCGFIIRFRPNLEKVNPLYILYLLRSPLYRKLFTDSSVQTNISNINQATLGGIEIFLPELQEQNRLISILDCLDSKIEINNKINQELEGMAKTLYDYWFVQFDFPNEQGKPYKSSGGKMVYNKELKREIPLGWEVKFLSKITSVSNDSINPMLSPDKEFKHYSIPEFDSTKTYGTENGVEIRSNKFTVTEADVLVSKLNPWFSRVIYPVNEANLICSTEFVVWRTSNSNIKNFLYFLARSKHFISHCTQSATGTSNSHKRVNPSVMMRYMVAFHSDILQMFGNTVEPWIKMSIYKQQENKQLTDLRDWLLPLLMNGQVTVHESNEKKL